MNENAEDSNGRDPLDLEQDQPEEREQNGPRSGKGMYGSLPNGTTNSDGKSVYKTGVLSVAL